MTGLLDTIPQLQPDARTLGDVIAAGPTLKALGLLLPGADVARATVERVHFPGARPVQVQIRVETKTQGTLAVLAEWVGDAAPDLAASEAARLAKPRRGQMVPGSGPVLVADTASGLVLRRPGFDTRLPGLRLLHDDDWAQARLGAMGLDPQSTRQLVAHRLGKRAVLRLDGRHGTCFARLRPVTSGAGKGAFDQHCALWGALGTQADLTIPCPMGFDADIGVALFKALPGRSPMFMGAEGQTEVTTVMQAIAALHAVQLIAQKHSATDELDVLCAWFDRVQTVFPALAQGLLAPMHRIRQQMDALAKPDFGLCHRDLHEGQVLLHRGRVGLLDFDTMRLADPALDIGNLQAHLVLAESRDGIPRRALIAAMEAARPELAPEQIRIWRNAALLRLAMIYAFTTTPPAVINKLIQEVA